MNGKSVCQYQHFLLLTFWSVPATRLKQKPKTPATSVVLALMDRDWKKEPERRIMHYLLHSEECHSCEKRIRSCLVLSSNSLQIQLICHLLKAALQWKQTRLLYKPSYQNRHTSPKRKFTATHMPTVSELKWWQPFKNVKIPCLDLGTLLSCCRYSRWLWVYIQRLQMLHFSHPFLK